MTMLQSLVALAFLSTAAADQATTNRCVNKKCGCDLDGASWCSKEKVMDGIFCSGSEDNCEKKCGGEWCEYLGGNIGSTEYYTESVGTAGWCDSGLDEFVGLYDNAEDCWAGCKSKYGDDLVAIDWWIYSMSYDYSYNGYCYCQDACECMADVGDSEGTLIVDTSKVWELPEECPPSNSDPSFECYIKACGCPGSFQNSWCKADVHAYDPTEKPHCYHSTSNCENSCGGVVCPKS